MMSSFHKVKIRMRSEVGISILCIVTEGPAAVAVRSAISLY